MNDEVLNKISKELEGNLDDILSALTNTENKIFELQQFSSNDFSFLNQKFLSFHKKNKDLILKITEFSGFILHQVKGKDSPLDHFIDRIEKIPKVLNTILEDLTKLMIKYNKLNDTIDFLHVPLNNYKQNLITLKLLSANLKIDKTTQKSDLQIKGKVDNVILTLENICLFFPKIEKYSEQYKKINNSTTHQIAFFISDVIKPFVTELNGVVEFTSVYSEKLEKTKETFLNLESQNELNQKNVEKIITNLQYQDIIRQRIEHIQETHSDMIADLKNVGLKKAEDSDKSKIFLKVKDIVGLQSAHLIHINKEFQTAIDTISVTIRDYNEQIGQIFDRSSDIMGFFAGIEKMYDIKIKQPLKIERIKQDIKKNANLLGQNINSLNSKSMDLSKYIYEVFDITGQIEKIKNVISDDSDISTLNKIVDLLNENLNLSMKIEMRINEFEKLNDATAQGYQKVENDIVEINNSLNILENSSFTKNLVDITYSMGEIESLISENKKEQKYINKALHELEYYQFFERNVKDITDNLHNVNKLFVAMSSDEKGSTDYLEEVKKRYTMEHEHEVHNKVFGKESTEKGMDELPIDDGDDLELF